MRHQIKIVVRVEDDPDIPLYHAVAHALSEFALQSTTDPEFDQNKGHFHCDDGTVKWKYMGEID